VFCDVFVNLFKTIGTLTFVVLKEHIMKQYTFKDGLKIVASTKSEAMRKHKVLASKDFTVYVGGDEVNDNLLSLEEAKKIADKYRKDGYDDVQVMNVKTNKVVASNATADKEEFVGGEYLLVPVESIVNKGWLLRFKRIMLMSENSVGIKKGMRKEKIARTLPKMMKLINEDK
jgi:hypothetical protein